MKKIFYCLMVICLIAQSAMAQNSPQIYVTGVGKVTAFPNAAEITLSMKFVRPTLREAINENQKTASQVLAITKQYVIDTNEIKVSLISTDKVMRWDATLKKEVFVGFESSQKIIFTLKELAAMQNFTEAVLKTKIYEIEKISYFHTDGANFVRQAQEMAVADAMETTNRLAKAANVKLGKVFSMETNSSPTGGRDNSVNSYNFHTYGKGMGGEGVSSSGQLIHFTATVKIYTLIE
ncbi:MAG: DUF541 domain-containing protein [Bacteroidetes bacterium]|jgi:uncharacterized protein|nr:DUF541 domain-containing protein [Bacteroidota bacterium]